ncbi:hypothetical protein N0B44_20895 [Roseibacterium beibuensis]|uniref:hypothetical protein n=1 Tax=[Roseibacterium] beibuensis TaxID=1193142 RepID=UPI00217D712B|nr:hypothetical protein [Roseibacterium beibuensis]MCS6625372.1 hypothetical protein [Roseibacterium beibuensis]
MPNPGVNNQRDLNQMMQDINQACANATVDLQRVMRQEAMKELPHVYVIPEIEVEVAVNLTSENGVLRAIFSDKDTVQSTSRLKFKYIAIPRGGVAPPGG